MGHGADKWLSKAEKDFDLAQDNFRIGNNSASMFFCHQAAEKALKSLIINRTGEKEFTHNLVLLSKQLDIEKDISETLAELNPFYTGFRYPDEESPEVENPEKIIKEIGELLKWTKKQLKK